MTPDEATRQALEERHFAVSSKPFPTGSIDICFTDEQDWPCDTAKALALTTTDHPDVRAGLALLDDVHKALHLGTVCPDHEGIRAALSATSEPMPEDGTE
jgi:hypothetical protein